MFELYRRAKAIVGILIPRIVPVQVGLPIVTVPVGVRHVVVGEVMIIPVRTLGNNLDYPRYAEALLKPSGGVDITHYGGVQSYLFAPHGVSKKLETRTVFLKMLEHGW